ncbi:LOW QUALITY PROTEIN: ribosome quality control complex subunit NEMF-like [Ruditapes philippinarum]|uniref:LOW QUALITY PROTEIN: ribosome quality control complex subunit NEMF-like n=1 Tax=Ruditapes philippinarum TaxID=129788 RepID=UPI00295AC8E3|nr:LOW QUALITY PROTEIN: ribosome quality control complex subunit NEMF-like [Ruditapes philippinarum]
MKGRFSTIDITAVIRELLRFVSMRVMNVYDVDNKTYLIRLGKPDDKAMILMESGIRLHSTEFEWPKNPAPSGFSMKMRKHLKGRRLESVEQLGVDRIVDLTFGSGEAAYHVILELYDRGNIVLTDYEYTILNILRPRTDQSQDVRFAVRETYPLEGAKQHELPTEEKLREIILAGKVGDPLKKLLIPHLDYGPAMIEHCLITAGFQENVKIGKGFDVTKDMQKLLVAIEEAEGLLTLMQTQNSKGFIVQKSEKRPNAKEGEPTELLTFDEFHPMLFKQYEKRHVEEFESFNKAVDEFYSKMESQKMELKTLQQEKTALKKLDNIKKDHEKRVEGLQKEQDVDKKKGQLIEINLDLVDRAILIVRSAIANQIDWTEIHNLVKEAQMDGDPVAMAIKDLKLATNHITLLLQNPYVDSDFEEDEDDDEPIKPMKIDIDLALSAYANSRKYFEKKKQAAVKEQKTVDASQKAFKSAEKKTKETLKDVATAASINKVRKTHWFEKFLWFISSENFLVIGGRDQQQNELIVKRYLRQGDVYVHADLHGASSVIIKNNTGEPIPPKTLNEAGTMAICNSAAWDAKVVTSAWWVYPSQVSKTAPSGEYLTTGSFMIRGKKNYLPPSYLIYGFGLLFKLEEGSIHEPHAGERKVRTAEDDEISVADSSVAESEITMETISDNEVDSDDEQTNNDNNDDTDRENAKNVSKNEENTDNSARTKVKSENINESDSCEESVRTEGDMDDKVCDNTKSDKICDGVETSEREVVNDEKKFPDTEINLHHVKGDKYELARSFSTQSTDSDQIFLGDDEAVTFGEKKSTGGPRLSAKQRREMKKAKKQGQQPQLPTQTEGEEEEEKSWLPEDNQGRGRNKGKKENKEQTEIQQQPKRGQKAKMKKLKDKYKDQDEERKTTPYEILASAGIKKEDKKKKGKKDEKGRPQSAVEKKPQQQQQRKKPELVDIIIKDVENTASTEDPTNNKEIVEAQVIDDDEKLEDDTQTTDDQQILNSLTGIPNIEDELLFALPVCAPYNALTNYKYKVKLLPGSTKRGKAAKIAINMFQYDKTITPRERDLVKILKDVDISRNIPGKVKVTAPNISKMKRK